MRSQPEFKSRIDYLLSHVTSSRSLHACACVPTYKRVLWRLNELTLVKLLLPCLKHSKRMFVHCYATNLSGLQALSHSFSECPSRPPNPYLSGCLEACTRDGDKVNEGHCPRHAAHSPVLRSLLKQRKHRVKEWARTKCQVSRGTSQMGRGREGTALRTGGK